MMGILRDIMTAIRGGAREAGEAVVDANATRIFEQQIKDAEGHLAKAKNDLTEVMAKQMQVGREVKTLENDVSEHETYATQALDKGNEELALEIAEKISTFDSDLAEQQEVYNMLKANVTRMKELVRKSERQINEYKRQLSMVKTTDSVQKATSAISDSFSASSSRVLSAKESLERIKKKQADFDDKLVAAEQLQDEMSDKDLKAKMAEAGIGAKSASASSVLDRIKAKKG